MKKHIYPDHNNAPQPEQGKPTGWDTLRDQARLYDSESESDKSDDEGQEHVVDNMPIEEQLEQLQHQSNSFRARAEQKRQGGNSFSK